jgi:hypothetical protein
VCQGHSQSCRYSLSRLDCAAELQVSPVGRRSSSATAGPLPTVCCSARGRTRFATLPGSRRWPPRRGADGQALGSAVALLVLFEVPLHRASWRPLSNVCRCLHKSERHVVERRRQLSNIVVAVVVAFALLALVSWLLVQKSVCAAASFIGSIGMMSLSSPLALCGSSPAWSRACSAADTSPGGAGELARYCWRCRHCLTLPATFGCRPACAERTPASSGLSTTNSPSPVLLVPQPVVH